MEDPIIRRALIMYVDGFRTSTDFSCRHLSARQYYGKAITQGFISPYKTSWGRVDYSLTDKGRQYGRQIYAEDLKKGRQIIKEILAAPGEAV